MLIVARFGLWGMYPLAVSCVFAALSCSLLFLRIESRASVACKFESPKFRFQTASLVLKRICVGY